MSAIDFDDLNIILDEMGAQIRSLKFYPEESPFKKGSHFLIMALSLKGLLNHIADYLLFLSDIPSFWFALNMSYDHAFHLSR